MTTILHVLVLILKLIFLPLKVLTTILYEPDQIIAYSWYTRAEFNRLMLCADNEEGEGFILIESYEEWLENAERAVIDYQNRGYIVVRFDINVINLKKWLKAHELANTQKNRQIYTGELFRRESELSLRIQGKKLPLT